MGHKYRNFSFHGSHEFDQCIAKHIITTRGTNIWIKFISFINDEKETCCKKIV